MAYEEDERKTKDIVRLLLAHEHRKMPVKRQEITQILGDQRKHIKTYIDRVNEHLAMFGLKLAELPASKRRKATSQYILKNAIGYPEKGDTLTINDPQSHAILGVLLSLIMIHRDELAEYELQKYLDNLNVDPGFIDKYLKTHYIDKSTEKSAEGETTFYHWGPRSFIEFDWENFVLSFYDQEEQRGLESILKDISTAY